MENFITTLINFLTSESTSLLVVVVFLIVMLIIWKSLSGRFMKKIIFGTLISIIISAILFFALNVPLETVGIIGIVTFILGVIFKKVERP